MALVTPVITTTKIVMATKLSTIVNPLFFILYIEHTLRNKSLQGEIRLTLTYAGMTFNLNNYFRLKSVRRTCSQNIKNEVVDNNLRSSHRHIFTAINLFFNRRAIQPIGNLNSIT